MSRKCFNVIVYVLISVAMVTCLPFLFSASKNLRKGRVDSKCQGQYIPGPCYLSSLHSQTTSTLFFRDWSLITGRGG